MAEPVLYVSRDPKRYFVVPEGVRLPAGEWVIRTPRGRPLRTTEEAVVGFEVPAERGAALEREVRAEMVVEGRALLGRLERWQQVAAELARVAGDARAGVAPGDRSQPARLGEALGVRLADFSANPGVTWDVTGDVLLGLWALCGELVEGAPAGRAAARQSDLARALAPLGVAEAQVAAVAEMLRSQLGAGAREAGAASLGARLAAAEAQGADTTLWAGADGRYFLVPDEVEPARGTYTIWTSSGDQENVELLDIELYAVQADAARLLWGRRWDRGADAVTVLSQALDARPLDAPGQPSGEAWRAGVASLVQGLWTDPGAAGPELQRRLTGVIGALVGLLSPDAEARAEAAARLERQAATLDGEHPDSAAALRRFLEAAAARRA